MGRLVNWCHENSVTISGHVETLAHYAGEKLGIDGDRVIRILATIDLDQCHPAAHYRGGDESCWRKVRRLDRATFEDNCPNSIKEAIGGHPPSRNGGNGGNGNGGGHNNGDGYLPERNKWNSPESWNGELGYWTVTKRNKIDKETGEILNEMENVRVFQPKCNFDLEIERELSDAEGGGFVLQFKRSVDNKQRRVIIRSTESLTIKEFNQALTMAENALVIAGFLEGQGSFCKVSESALYEHLKLSGSLPLLWDDPDRSPWLDTLIQRLYNGKSRTVRGNSQNPHTSLMITSNHLIGDDKPAALSRLLPLAIFPSVDGDKNAWDDLVAAQKGASGALPQLIGLLDILRRR